MAINPQGFYKNSQQKVEQNSNLLFLKSGVTQLRVLPAYSEKGAWYREIKEIPLYVNGKFAPQVSPSTLGQPCPFTQEGQRLYKLGGEQNVELAGKFRPRSSFLFNVVVQSFPDSELDINNCIRVLKCGKKVRDQILDLDQDYAGGWGNMTDLTQGFDIRITRTGSSKNDTTYVVKPIPKRTNILEWLEEHGFKQDLVPFNLDDMFQPKPYDELVKLLESYKSELEAPTVTPVKVTDSVGDSMPQAPVKTVHTVPKLEI